jgi:Protein of unknown function (DUF4254)
MLVRAEAVAAFHDECLTQADWPADSGLKVSAESAVAADTAALWHWIRENHRNNCLLWAQEDLARRTAVSGDEIAANKRAIDKYNQARNDATERVDEYLLIALGLVSRESATSSAPQAKVAPGARQNSETAGSILDRASIMSLKIKAMHEQLARQDVDAAFIASTRLKLDRLLEQRADLVACFNTLLADCLSGKAYFKVYRQFKMYNDANLNPVLVAEARERSAKA